MRWDDDDDDDGCDGECGRHCESLPPPAKCAGDTVKACFVARAAMGNAQLHFKTSVEDAKHRQACTHEACDWCKTLRFLEKRDTAFQVVADGLMGSSQYRDLSEKHKVLAKTPWLGKGHRGNGDIVLGCIPCRALQDPRLCTNPFASYQVLASRLFEATGKPHVLLRHTATTLHAKAVSKFLGIDTGTPRRIDYQ